MAVFLFCGLFFSTASIVYYASKNDLALDFASFLDVPSLNEVSEYDLPFLLIKNNEIIGDFDLYSEAINAALLSEDTEVHLHVQGNLIWHRNINIAEKVLLNVPLIEQLPELPRGCEVTSLAMLFAYHQLSVDKMFLAEKVTKDPTPYHKKGDTIYFGDPHQGFVGDMYNRTNPGYGVYHLPIEQLAKEYTDKDVINLTGTSFDHVLLQLSQGHPVWIISNTKYSKLPSSAFETWQTPNGPREITYHLHSVVITGFDQEFIYFNDPLEGTKNRKIPRKSFIEAWEQMGKQAIVLHE